MNVKTYLKNGLLFTRVSNNKNLTVYFCSLGASIFQINYDRYVSTRNVYDLVDFKKGDIYYGKTIGRTVNRFRGNKLKYKNEIFEVRPNEGNNTLHGGLDSLSNQVFDILTLVKDEYIDVIYSKRVLESEDHFLGDVDIKITYRVHLNSNELDVIYEGTGDSDYLLSLTNHSYFTLGNKSLEGLKLEINASHYLKTDESLLPLSKDEVTKELDFRQSKRINKDINSFKTERMNGYDHYFYFDEVDISRRNICLSNSKFDLEIYTDFEGVQIYTSGFSLPVDLYPKCDKTFDSIAIEPGDSYLKIRANRKGSLYNRTIKYLFINKDE